MVVLLSISCIEHVLSSRAIIRSTLYIANYQKTKGLARITPRSMKMASSTTIDTSFLTGKLEIPIIDAIRIHGSNDVKFVDGSWWLGNSRPTSNRQDYENGPRIAGATFLDIDDIADKDSKPTLPHMMPSAKLFESAMDEMKISNTDHIIVYAQDKCPFVHRAWFQFGCMGHDWSRVHVLQGSLKDWIDSNGPIDTNPVEAILSSRLDLTKSTSYQAIDPRNTVDIDEIRRIVRERKFDDTILIDARAEDRFYGRVDEPRPGLIRGHIPGAKNLFFLSLLDQKNPTIFNSLDELKSCFTDAGVSVDVNKNDIRMITTCGSGATACTLAAALYRCGIDPSRLFIYDGSWIEWGNPEQNHPDLIVTTT